MNLIDITPQQVEQYYKNTGLLPISKKIHAGDGKCCALGVILVAHGAKPAKDSELNYNECLHEIGIKTDGAMAFAVGFDAGFFNIITDSFCNTPYSIKGYEVGAYIRKAFASEM